MSYFKAKMHHISAGDPPQTPLGSLQRYLDPLAEVRGLISSGGNRGEGRDAIYC